MELQELKSVWTKVIDEERIKYEFDQNKVQEMIHQKSNTILAKVERKLKYKRLFCGVIGSFAMLLSPVYLFLKEGDINLFGNVLSNIELFSITFLLGVALFILCVNFHIIYKKVRRQRTTSEGLKITLKKVNDLLNGIMKLTIVLDATFMPLIAFLVLYRLFFKDQSFQFDIRIIYTLLATVLTFIGIRKVSKRPMLKIWKIALQISMLWAIQKNKFTFLSYFRNFCH